jgi:predicted transglutaminase-like cysteine proteinase
MSISARLWRLGALAFVAIPLFACSQTANLSQAIAPTATPPQSALSPNTSATITDALRLPETESSSLRATATQGAPPVIPPLVAAALARGLNSQHLKSADVASVAPVAAESVGSSELFGDPADFSGQPFQRWLNVFARFDQQRNSAEYACPSGDETTCPLAWWNSFVNTLRSLPLRERVIVVNDVLNQVPYVPAESNWGDSGYWETPLEFLTHAGQCQDYANAKYLALAQSGVPDSLMRFVVVHDNVEALDHAILIVYVDGVPMVLDNQNPAVLPAAQIQRYTPYYALNNDGSWIYELPVRQGVPAQVAVFPHPTFELARY